MISSNFEILRSKWPELASLAGFAEAYTHTDPASAIVKLRQFAEVLTKDIYRDLALPRPVQSGLVDLLNNDAFKAITPRVVIDKLHAIRIHGNKAAHGEPATPVNATWLLREAFDLGRWLYVTFEKGDASSIAAFKPPAPVTGLADDVELRRQNRQTLEKLAAQEAQMEAMLQELESARAQLASRERTAAESKVLAAAGQQTADVLAFSEATTRSRIIDSLLRSSDWNIAQGEGDTAEVTRETEVPHQPTSSGIGYADYVLWDDDGSPLAVIEAKKTSVDPELGRKQAKLYADGLEKKYGIRPVIFYTNGYDIWLWDDAQGYPPRKLFGYYSKSSLQYLVRYQRRERKPLNSVEVKSSIVNRLYQIEAIKRVSERFTAGHRRALLVQATGTGKTRVAIALVDLMMRTGWVKRVLFLCDRRELRKQAKNAFGDHLDAPVRIVSGRVDSSAPERVFIATYPAMQRVFESFDAGFFDLIIADESHRSIYNVYGDLFSYFDGLQIGLTATPVDFVARNTFRLFGCEGLLPTSNYDLEQAVADGHLTPFEVFTHTTPFLRDGISLQGLTKEQIRELEEQGEDPATMDFGADEIDKAIFNKDTNRHVLRNLMENGLRDATGTLPGKSIIFARNHQHAVLLRQLFDEMYPQYGGRFCQVIDNYDPRAEQLIDDFKGEGDNNEFTIAISVDMLDTGVDIPEILNLVFAKPIRSPVKFWQMIGRGTRLCPDLFGPGRHKSIFRIFDHWGNFQRFEMGYRPAEPAASKSLLQNVFEQRVVVAQLALDKSEVAAFDALVGLVSADIEALPEDSVAVRECWKEKRAVLVPGVLKAFAPATIAMVRQRLAPLMQWRNIRGLGDAYALDLLIAHMQAAVLRKSNEVGDLRIALRDRLGALQMHLNPVREKEAVIRRVKSDEFWKDLSVAKLEEVRIPLREIMHHRLKTGARVVPVKIIDVREDPADVDFARRTTTIQSVDMAAYKSSVEGELRKHFDTNPVLQKIRRAEPVTETELQSLVSLVLTRSPAASKDILEEFFRETASGLAFAIRAIVGLDPAAVEQRFADFARRHPKLTAKQIRFLGLLQNHISRFGSVTIDKLYEQPFTVVDADGLDGVFDEKETVDDLISTISVFAPPKEPGAEDRNTTEGTTH